MELRDFHDADFLNSITVKIEPEIDPYETSDDYFSESNISENNSNKHLETPDFALTSELNIKCEPPEVTDESSAYEYPIETGEQNRLMLRNNLKDRRTLKRLRMFKAYRCTFCDYTTVNIKDLQKHSLTHVKVHVIPDTKDGQNTSAIDCNSSPALPSHLPEAKRIYSPHYCIFCASPVMNFSRHIIRRHAKEEEVEKITSLPANSAMRKHMLMLLRKKGFFLYSLENPRIIRTSTVHKTPFPCSNCMGFYSANSIRRHKRKCMGPQHDYRARRQLIGQDIVLNDKELDSELREKIFSRMRGDEISLIAQSDPLICEFGAQCLKTTDTKEFLRMSNRMRELARLLILAQNLEPSIATVFDLLRTEHYPIIVKAVKAISKYDIRIDEHMPTLVGYIIRSLTDCCDIAAKSKVKDGFVASSALVADMQKDTDKLKVLLQLNLKNDIIMQAKNEHAREDMSGISGNQVVESEFSVWTGKQKDAVMSYFIKNFNNNVPPKKQDCQKLIELHSDLLKDKSWVNIQQFALECYFRLTKVEHSYANPSRKSRRCIVYWTKEQKKVANAFFQRHINSRIAPTKYECLKLIRLHARLYKNLNWEKIKTYVEGQYHKKAKDHHKKRKVAIRRRKEQLCYFCKIKVTYYAKHLIHYHRDQIIFKHFLSTNVYDSKANMCLTKFRRKKKRSINPNRSQIKLDENIRKILNNMLLCRQCGGYFKRPVFAEHKKTCKIVLAEAKSPVLKVNIPDTYRMDIREINTTLEEVSKNTTTPLDEIRKSTTPSDNIRKSTTPPLEEVIKNTTTPFDTRKSTPPLDNIRTSTLPVDNNSGESTTPSLDEIREGTATPLDITKNNFNFHHSLSIKDILDTMRLDDAADAGIGDVLICCYADKLSKKLKTATVRNVVSNGIRELGRFLIAMRNTTGIQNLLGVLKPELFDDLIVATRTISGYNPETNTFQAEYLPVKMGRVLKEACQTGIELVSKRTDLFGPIDIEKTVNNLNRLVTLIEHHWSSDLSRSEPVSNDDEFEISCDGSHCLSKNDSVCEKNEDAAYSHRVKFSKVRFTEEEKELMKKCFISHIKTKQSPKKLEVLEFMDQHSTLFKSKNWVKIKAFIYNEYRLR